MYVLYSWAGEESDKTRSPEVFPLSDIVKRKAEKPLSTLLRSICNYDYGSMQWCQVFLKNHERNRWRWREEVSIGLKIEDGERADLERTERRGVCDISYIKLTFYSTLAAEGWKASPCRTGRLETEQQ